MIWQRSSDERGLLLCLEGGRVEGAAGAPEVDGAPRACAVAALPLDEGEVHGEEGLLPEGAARGYLQG